MYSAVVSMVGLSVKYPYNYKLFMLQVHYDCKNIEIAVNMKYTVESTVHYETPWKIN